MEGEGFEPSKAEPSDLQSDPFDRSGTPPNETADYEYIGPISQSRIHPIAQYIADKHEYLYCTVNTSCPSGDFYDNLIRGSTIV